VLRRLPIVIFLVVAIDFLLLAAFTCWFGWQPALTHSGLMTLVGLLVILNYEWRWSDLVAEHLAQEPLVFDGWALEKMLLLVAGIVLLIPGLLTDVLGLVLLIPAVRRWVVAHSNGARRVLRHSPEKR
jgi:UPF0716 protein FxsA